ncbi:MAG: D-glucuronyl C5-epimerase family protein [Actinobacteria bacterium]|nr:D-glucuronyl C5-epimerase family protein [Actinomycetota bacterium]
MQVDVFHGVVVPRRVVVKPLPLHAPSLIDFESPARGLAVYRIGKSVKLAVRHADPPYVDRRRSLAVLTLLIAVAVAFSGRGDPPQTPPARAASLDHPAQTPAQRAATAARARERREAARQAEARRLRRSTTVKGALRRAWLSRAISRSRYEALRRTWWRAQRDVGRLSGTRRAELAAVLAMAERLAAGRMLTASRLDPVFLTIRRNREFWTTRPLPVPRTRLSFRRDPVVFEYYAGRGLAIQPLASFGRANALAASCLRTGARHRCRPAALGRLLDRMVALASERGGFLAWEHFFAFGSGSAPWISAMTQATGAQALARGRRALGDERYARAARRALKVFDAPPPLGVAVPAGGGVRYAMYSFAPDLRVLNGELQTLIGLRDVARIAGSGRARRLFERGEPVARRAVRGFDTGAWSLYSAGGKESTLSYHRLVAGFLGGLCRRTAAQTYCDAAQRFERYVREPPRVHVRTLRALRIRKSTTIRFRLSKISDVMMQVRDRRGRIVLSRGLRALPRGRHGVGWVPSRAGRHRLRIVAVGPAGTRVVVARTLRAADAAKPAKKKAKAKEKARRD